MITKLSDYNIPHNKIRRVSKIIEWNIINFLLNKARETREFWEANEWEEIDEHYMCPSKSHAQTI